MLARTAVPEEPEPCSPEEPCPKSKSRARAVLADDPELCLPKQQSEEPVPCFARYPHVHTCTFYVIIRQMLERKFLYLSQCQNNDAVAL